MGKRNRRNQSEIVAGGQVEEQTLTQEPSIVEIEGGLAALTAEEQSDVGSESTEGNTEESKDETELQQEQEESNEETSTTEEVRPGRKSALKDDSVITVQFTDNPQRKGTYSHKYNETLRDNNGLTVNQAMELGIPRHHINYLLKMNHIAIS